MAVVAAILKSGLRIMPHSGGRVGSGIYFASENAKSACYGRLTITQQLLCTYVKWNLNFVLLILEYGIELLLKAFSFLPLK